MDAFGAIAFETTINRPIAQGKGRYEIKTSPLTEAEIEARKGGRPKRRRETIREHWEGTDFQSAYRNEIIRIATEFESFRMLIEGKEYERRGRPHCSSKGKIYLRSTTKGWMNLFCVKCYYGSNPT